MGLRKSEAIRYTLQEIVIRARPLFCLRAIDRATSNRMGLVGLPRSAGLEESHVGQFETFGRSLVFQIGITNVLLNN